MKYFSSILVLSILVGFLLVKPASAMVKITDSSASLKHIEAEKIQDNRVKLLKKYLIKYDSVLSSHAEYIVQTADEYQIPWTLIVAISGVESTFCKRIPHNSSNCWGWNNGETHFKDFEEAITIVSKTLRNKYYDRGLDTPEKIARVYAPPSPSWGWKVKLFMDKIETFSPTTLVERITI